MSSHGGQCDVPDKLLVSECIGEVVPAGPYGRPSGSRFERDECRPERAPAEQEVPRCRELRHHAHAPVQVVAVRLHPQEGPCVHGAAPYRRSSARPQLGAALGRRQRSDRGDDVGSQTADVVGLPPKPSADRFRAYDGAPKVRSGGSGRLACSGGCSSAGRAAALQAVGRGFESLHLHR